MDYNPNILPAILRARALTQRQLCERLKIEEDELVRELRRASGPKQSILNRIAEELALPSFVFFMTEAPPLSEVIPDFRSNRAAFSAKSRATTESIQFAEGIQKTVTQLGAGATTRLPRFDSESSKTIEEFALQARSFFELTVQDQSDAKDAGAFYTVCRKRIEDKGIFVLHDSYPEADGSGFCLWQRTNSIIVVNTKLQTRGRRLFTLLHELAHVLMHRSGVSDPFVTTNATEARCNRFASSFLVPQNYVKSLLGNFKPVKDPDLDDVAATARRLKISQEATVLRLEQLGLFKAGSHAKWKRIIDTAGNPDFSEKGGGAGGPPPQEKVKLAKYGFRFAAAFDTLLQK